MCPWYKGEVHKSGLFVLLLLLFPCSETAEAESVSLAGEWQFRLDPMEVGVRQQWFNSELNDTARLPGTTDLNRRGFPLNKRTGEYEMTHSGRTTEVQVLRTQWPGTHIPARADEAEQLVRDWFYVGTAWYQRDIEIPEAWANRQIQLRLERVLWKSEVWIDSRRVGSYDSLVAEHRYDLGALSPGVHRLTICVDNSMVHNIGILGHSYGPETQSRWNGIVGDIELVAVPAVSMSGIQIYPAADGSSVEVRLTVRNATGARTTAELELLIQDGHGDERTTLDIQPGEQVFSQVVNVKKAVRFWDEFQPTRYRLTARLRNHEVTERFGFRDVTREGRSIKVNGRRIFLRGTLDCALYPKTGHPPMEVSEWLEVLRTVKEFGFNHVRFHTWCPPEAAFEAADQLGVYLAPETPFWVDNWTVQTSSHPKLLGADDDVVRYVRNEIARISEAYGNHPSFAFFSIGNEFGMDSDWDLANRLLDEVKRSDPRRLYNATSARKTVSADDYWVTHAVGRRARVRGVGPPHTDWDYSEALSQASLPVVSHETGQRPVFPDFDALLPKFTGPLRPYNLLRLKRILDASGLAEQAPDFRRASAMFQYVQYKAEHEALLRSAESAGYQLLMLTDFVGQSEALPGILDPFRDEKGFISREAVRQWNAPTVLLARFPRYVWTAGDRFSAEVEIAHFGPGDLDGVAVEWSLRTASGEVVARGRMGPVAVPTGGNTDLGAITALLDKAPAPATLTLSIIAGAVSNQWPIWVYPPANSQPDSSELVIAHEFDSAARNALERGKSVLLIADGLTNARAAQTRFESVYWSAGWWGNAFSSLGVLCDPSHPALALFPNAGHSDWQWYELAEGATTFLLDDAPQGFRPIVQLVPDYHFNRLLGQVFEARVGPGHLLVCGYDLSTDLDRRLAAAQMRRSLIEYMKSPSFHPEHELSTSYLNRLLSR